MAYLKKIEELKQLQLSSIPGVINADTIAVLSFAMRKNAQAVHKCNHLYNIGHNMHQERDSLCEALDPTSGICWESPIVLFIERDPVGLIFSDYCLSAGDGYSLEPILYGILRLSGRPMPICLRILTSTGTVSCSQLLLCSSFTLALFFTVVFKPLKHFQTTSKQRLPGFLRSQAHPP